MTRIEYMEKLANALKEYDDDFAMDILEDYRRHFDEAAKDGRSEESVCDELGSVEEFIKDIPEEFKKESGKHAEQTEEESKKESRSEENGPEEESEEQKQQSSGSFYDMAGKLVNAAGKIAAEVADSLGNALDNLGETILNYDKKNRGGSEDDDCEGTKSDDFEIKDKNPLLFGSFRGITSLSLGQVYADVEVLTQDGDELTVTLSRPITKKEEMYFKTDVETDVCGAGRKLIISQSSKKGRLGSINTEPITFYVHLPESCKEVHFSTVSGNITFNGEFSSLKECRATTVSGKIDMKEPLNAEKIILHSVSGSIKASNRIAASQVKLENVSGSIKALLDAQEFAADTVSGGIKLFLDKPCTGKLATVSGGMKIKLLSDTGIDVKSSSMSGSLKLITEQHVTWDGGGNSVDFGKRGSRSAAFGNAGIRLKTNSVSGSVKIYDYNVEEE